MEHQLWSGDAAPEEDALVQDRILSLQEQVRWADEMLDEKKRLHKEMRQQYDEKIKRMVRLSRRRRQAQHGGRSWRRPLEGTFGSFNQEFAAQSGPNATAVSSLLRAAAMPEEDEDSSSANQLLLKRLKALLDPEKLGSVRDGAGLMQVLDDRIQTLETVLPCLQEQVEIRREQQREGGGRAGRKQLGQQQYQPFATTRSGHAEPEALLAGAAGSSSGYPAARLSPVEPKRWAR